MTVKENKPSICLNDSSTSFNSTSYDNGGALCCTSVQYLLVESSSFFSCKTGSQSGGAIYFYNTNNGQCALQELCVNDCCSTYNGYSNGQFVYIVVHNTATSKNYVTYSSFARCVNENSGSCRNLFLYYGKIICPSVNITM
jgi:hypothetical protein